MPKEIIIKFSEEDAEEIFELLRALLDRVNNGSVDDGQDGSGGDQDDCEEYNREEARYLTIPQTSQLRGPQKPSVVLEPLFRAG